MGYISYDCGTTCQKYHWACGWRAVLLALRMNLSDTSHILSPGSYDQMVYIVTIVCLTHMYNHKNETIGKKGNNLESCLFSKHYTIRIYALSPRCLSPNSPQGLLPSTLIFTTGQ